jgi:hypothetical protein
MLSQIVKGSPSERVQTAEMIVDRLMEEGLLNLGYGNADVENIVVTFTDTFGTTKVSKQDRFAAHRLAQKYGSQAVCGIIRLLAEKSTEKYSPVVGSVAQLESKWVNVLNFLRTTDSDEVIQV